MDPPTVYISKDGSDDEIPHSRQKRIKKRTGEKIMVDSCTSSDEFDPEKEETKEFLKNIRDGGVKKVSHVKVQAEQATSIDPHYIHEVIVHPEITDPKSLRDISKKSRGISTGQSKMKFNEDLLATQKSNESSDHNTGEPFSTKKFMNNVGRKAVGRPHINISNNQKVEPEDV